MGIQINGQTDIVTSTSVGGRVTIPSATFPSVDNLNATGIVTASSFRGALTGNVTGNITGNVNASGVSTFSSGVIVSAGSTAVPSISPSGDSNTGIFFPSADTVAIGEGGTEVLRVNDNSSVRVYRSASGTSAVSTEPSFIIRNTNGTSANSTGIAFERDDGSSLAGIYVKRDGTTPASSLVFATADANSPYNNTERFRISSAGNISWTTVNTLNGGGLNLLSLNTFNNNSANSIGAIIYGFVLITITQGNGYTVIPFYQNSGGGVAWSGSMLDPDAGTFTYSTGGTTVSFATVGTSANSYTIALNQNLGGATIQRTAGSASYTVAVSSPF